MRSSSLTKLLVSRSMKLEFEWHEAKAAANLQDHGVSFELATTVFKDPFAIERLDDREDYGGERFVIVGHGGPPCPAVRSLHRARTAYPYYFSSQDYTK